MGSLRRSVPSLGTLAVFEAAARLGGFTRAADELGVTQAAVSRQIRALEEELNTPLFLRGHRKIQLTAAGRVLAEAVGTSFERIADAVEVVRHPTRPEILTVSTTLAFSHFWLLPRLPSFRNEHPALELRVISQDAPIDLRDGEIDVILRFGRAPFRDGEVVASFPESAYPVASPDFAARLGDDFRVERLAELPIIEIDPVEPAWMTWRRWFDLAGLKRPSAHASPACTRTTTISYGTPYYADDRGEGGTLGIDKPPSRARRTTSASCGSGTRRGIGGVPHLRCANRILRQIGGDGLHG